MYKFAAKQLIKALSQNMLSFFNRNGSSSSGLRNTAGDLVGKPDSEASRVRQALLTNAFTVDMVSKLENPIRALIQAGVDARTLHAIDVSVQHVLKREIDAGEITDARSMGKALRSFGLHKQQNIMRDVTGTWGIQTCADLLPSVSREALQYELGVDLELPPSEKVCSDDAAALHSHNSAKVPTTTGTREQGVAANACVEELFMAQFSSSSAMSI